MNDYYDIIYKRKSIRKYDEALHISKDELNNLENMIENVIPLVSDIKVKFKIVERTKTTAKRGEYCLLMYSENKPHYLLNAGYMLEQIDLFLTSHNIGVCWYALAKPNDYKVDGLDYIIMLSLGQSKPEDFRKSISEFKRKSIEEIWEGNFDQCIKETVRLAPSACNTQPWRIRNDSSSIKVYRNTNIKSFIPASKLPYYNSIDIGIFLCFLEISLNKRNYKYERILNIKSSEHLELLEIAKYDYNK